MHKRNFVELRGLLGYNYDKAAAWQIQQPEICAEMLRWRNAMSRIQKVNITFLGMFLLSVIVAYSGVGKAIDSYTWRLVFSQFILFAPAMIYFATDKQSYAQAVRLKKMKISSVLWVILFCVLMRPALSLISAISLLYSRNYTVGYMSQLTGQKSIPVALTVVALIPCIVEESIFRGVFYNEYSKVRPRTAIFMSALMFGLVHGNLNQFTYAFAMGVVFALVIEATDSILSSMVIHFISNGLSILMLYAINIILPKIGELRDAAIAAGDKTVASSLESAFGSGDITIDGIVASQNQMSSTLGEVMAQYGLPALVFGVLAFVVYRQMAISNGRWQHVKNIFSKGSTQGETSGENSAMHEEGSMYQKMLDTLDMPSQRRVVTWPLVAGLVLYSIDMILNELILRGIISF